MKTRNITAGVGLFLLGLAPGAMAFNTRGAQRTYDPYGTYGTYQQQRASTKFRGMDRNGDGIITRDEWRGNDKSFRKHDRNGDGVISAADERGNGNRQYNRQSNDDEHGNGKFKAKKDHRQERDEDQDD